MLKINLLRQETSDHASIKTCCNRKLNSELPIRSIDALDDPSEVFIRKAWLFSNGNISWQRRGLSKRILIQVVPSLAPVEESPKASDMLRCGGFCTLLEPPGNKTINICPVYFVDALVFNDYAEHAQGAGVVHLRIVAKRCAS